MGVSTSCQAVYTYTDIKKIIPCSSLKLSEALAFFNFVPGSMVELPDKRRIDIMPFMFGADNLPALWCHR